MLQAISFNDSDKDHSGDFNRLSYEYSREGNYVFSYLVFHARELILDLAVEFPLSLESWYWFLHVDASILEPVKDVGFYRETYDIFCDLLHALLG